MEAERQQAVVQQYFERVQRRDEAVADLFADDAVLLGLGQRVVGRAAIREFYKRAMREGSPTPSPPLRLLVSGDTVAVEVYIDLADGSQLHVMDVFEVVRGRISSLTYFIADHPSNEPAGGAGTSITGEVDERGATTR